MHNKKIAYIIKSGHMPTRVAIDMKVAVDTAVEFCGGVENLATNHRKEIGRFLETQDHAITQPSLKLNVGARDVFVTTVEMI